MELLQALSEWPVAAALRRSNVAYPLVSAAHIFSFGLLIGAIVTLDLRLLGFFKGHAVGALGPPLSRIAAVGLALAVVTGFLLFSVRPAAYVQNPAFLAKVGLVGLGTANAMLLRLNPYWHRALAGGDVHGLVKLSAALSFAIWAGAIVAGRWIGFLQ